MHGGATHRGWVAVKTKLRRYGRLARTQHLLRGAFKGGYIITITARCQDPVGKGRRAVQERNNLLQQAVHLLLSLSVYDP